MTIDTEKFRFRRFVEEMAKIGDVEVIESPTPLAAVADRLEGNPNGTWFRNVGPTVRNWPETSWDPAVGWPHRSASKSATCCRRLSRACECR